MNNKNYEKKWKADVKEHIRKVAHIVATVTHYYIPRDWKTKTLNRAKAKRKAITINLYSAVQFNSMAWPHRPPGDYSGNNYINYVEYITSDKDVFGDGYFLHGLDQFMGLIPAANIYPYLEKHNNKYLFYYDNSEKSGIIYDYDRFKKSNSKRVSYQKKKI